MTGPSASRMGVRGLVVLTAGFIAMLALLALLNDTRLFFTSDRLPHYQGVIQYVNAERTYSGWKGRTRKFSYYADIKLNSGPWQTADHLYCRKQCFVGDRVEVIRTADHFEWSLSKSERVGKVSVDLMILVGTVIFAWFLLKKVLV